MKTQDHIGIFLTLQSLLGPQAPNPMHIIKLNVLLLSFCFVQAIDAQTILSRVTFPIDELQTKSVLAKAGLDLTHGHGKLNSFFTTEVQDFELKRFDQQGIRYTIDIPDVSVFRHQGNHQSRDGLLECQDDLYDAIVPKNFELGQISGFYSLPEILDQLDAMALLYPHLISTRKPIGTFKTWKNNSIFWVRISDQPETDEEEPEILYTALTHAREFVSVSQMIFYMWYMLENYEKDPLIKQILDHTELYFVPVVNPDGLNYNVQGYDAEDDVFRNNHRKNLRDNDEDGAFNPEKDGVDLNRNFGGHWGYDDEGSSSTEETETYRGASPFSEPETRAIEFFCNSHEFKIAFNHHSYGNWLIYPWGCNGEHTSDSTTFSNYAQLLTGLNRFGPGLSIETVGYLVNGDSDDWMYGEHGTFAMTPETGDEGFFPPTESIIPLCKSTLQMNLLGARLVNSLIEITDESPNFIKPGINTLNLEFNRFGLLDGEVMISFNAVTPTILQVPAPITFNLEKFEAHQRDLTFFIDEQIPYGETVRMEIICRQGDYTFRDTITKIRGDFYTLLEDAGDIAQWDTSEGETWGTTNAAFKSGPVSITDSPLGMYGPNKNEVIFLKENIDLRNATAAYAQFWARWDLEDEYDYVVFQASTDGHNWTNLCGERSKLGGIFQLYEEPLYDGKQIQWVLETVDLQTYLGQQIQLRYMIVTDGFVFKDGFYFDDFKVITIRQQAVSTTDIDRSAFKAYPNPAGSSFRIEMPELKNPSIEIFNSLGQQVYSYQSVEYNYHDVMTASWPEGLYQYIIYSEGSPIHNSLISLIH